MALYHFHVGHISRGSGQTAVSAAAYRSGEALHDDYYNETPDYTRKGGVIYSEVMLPPHAPERLHDRETLWNEVEKAEKHPKAQLAYSFDIALQNELSTEENIALARRFVRENFVDRGMIADLAIHDPDKGTGGIPNPHFHILCPIRPISENGEWGAKQRREYLLDEHGERIIGKDGRYLFNAVPTTDWNSPETLKLWRKNWARLVNDAFREKGIDAKIDDRSYEERGIDIIPSVHEGPAVRAMEKKGIHTDKRDWNKLIRETNGLISRLTKRITVLIGWIADLKKILDEEASKQTARQESEAMLRSTNRIIRQRTLAEALMSYYDQRNANTYSNKAKVNNLKRQAETIKFLQENDIHSINDLSRKVSDMYSKVGDVRQQLRANESEAKEIRKLLDAFSKYQTNKPVFDKLRIIRGKAASEKYKKEHHTELSLFYTARRILQEKYPDGGAVPVNRLTTQLAELQSEHDVLFSKYSEMKSETDKIYSIKKAVEADYQKAVGVNVRTVNREKERKATIHR